MRTLPIGKWVHHKTWFYIGALYFDTVSFTGVLFWGFDPLCQLSMQDSIMANSTWCSIKSRDCSIKSHWQLKGTHLLLWIIDPRLEVIRRLLIAPSCALAYKDVGFRFHHWFIFKMAAWWHQCKRYTTIIVTFYLCQLILNWFSWCREIKSNNHIIMKRNLITTGGR